MEEFYKHIRDEVNKRPEAAAGDDAWSSFQAYSQDRESTTRKPFPWMWMALGGILGLLVLTNLYWLREAQQSSSVNHPTSTVVRDTIYITQVVAQESEENDQYKEQIASLSEQLESSRRQLSYLSKSYKAQNSRLDELLALPLIRGNKPPRKGNGAVNFLEDQNSLTSQTNDFISIQLDRSWLDIPSISLLGLAPLTIRDRSFYHPSSVIWIRNKKSMSLLDLIRPKSLSMVASIGSNQSIQERGRGLRNGIGFTSLFSRRIRGLLTLEHSDYLSKIEDIDNPDIPSITIAPGNRLKEIKRESSSLALSLRLEYLFRSYKGLRPFIGLGYARTLDNDEKYLYEIDSPNGEFYISPEGSTKLANVSHILMTLGSDINLSRRFDLRFSTSYQFANKDKSSFLTFDGGAYYHF